MSGRLPSGHRHRGRADVALEGTLPVWLCSKKAWCLMISFFPSPASLHKKDPEEKGKNFPHLKVQIR